LRKRERKRPSKDARPPRVSPAAVAGARAGKPGFPIVGIGASAGGLEALEQFLTNVPAHSGMAYVVVQHLDPTHKGAMVELLQRVTAMPVVQVRDRLRVEPDTVYVIPPNKDMSILHGVLHLLVPTAPRGLHLPIDFFFRSLADDQRNRSIGVVLSGMGSDGTLGLRAIKEKEGGTFVQSIAAAKFSGMPQSAIDAGLADVVAPAEELPVRIAAYERRVPGISRPETAIEDQHLSALEKVFVLLRAHTGNDFSLYKRSTIYRRVERRMSLHQLDKIANYVRYLRQDPRELELLFKELLIGVTSFFRDPPAWEHLRSKVLPDLLRARSRAGVIRAWVAGCSTGEEAYSLAIVFKEVMEDAADKRLKSLRIQIFATDLDRDAIEKARQGFYPPNIVADVSPERLKRFFLQDEHGFRVRKDVRESIVFAPQNIIMDPPFTKLDVLTCRNLLIYLSSELQKKLIPLFHYALNPGGILFLGSAETVGTSTDLFSPVDGRRRIYQRLGANAEIGALEFPAAFRGSTANVTAEPVAIESPKAPPTNLGLLADRLIVQRFAPAVVLTNDKGDILYISGRTGKYLEPAVGKANLNVFAMAREGLRHELSSAFAAALRVDGAVIAQAPRVQTNGSTQAVRLSAQRLSEPKELRGLVMIALEPAPPEPKPAPAGAKKGRRTGDDTRLEELERELKHGRDELQSTREEMQTSQEELKSTNEELQSTNEELQSTNEELTTSKEEMQSMNEELQTVNQELQAKVDELSRTSNDMKNLLNSTDIATLFLDGSLRVRRFTTPTAKLIKLIPADTGRPITDIAREIDYPELAEDAAEVLRTLIFKEKLASTRDGRWFSVRILPYRTIDNVIDGVVITFTDATAAKMLESKLREQADELRRTAAALPNLVWGCTPDGSCDYLSQRWVDYTGIGEADQLGHRWLEQVHAEDRDRVRKAWANSLRSGAMLDTEFRIRAKDGAYRWFKALGVPVRDARGSVFKWYCTGTDVDDLKKKASQAQ